MLGCFGKKKCLNEKSKTTRISRRILARKSMVFVAAVGLIQIVSLDAALSVGKNKRRADTEFAKHLSDQIEARLEKAIKSERVNVEKVDIDPAEPNKGSVSITMKIDKEANVTGVKCQAIDSYFRYEGYGKEAKKANGDSAKVSDKNTDSYLNKIPASLRLKKLMIEELESDKKRFFAILSKLGRNKANRIDAPGNPHPVKISEFHICFADITEVGGEDENTDDRFTVFVPKLILFDNPEMNKSNTDSITLSDFGFSNEQLLLEQKSTAQ